MNEIFRLRDPNSIQLGVTGAAPAEIQVIRTGTFHDSRYGQFTVDKKMLASFKKNFDAKVRGVDLAVDYKHDSDDVAAGWIKDLSLKNDDTELWATMDWTPTGAKVVSEKEFRYVSADFMTEYQDNETLKKYGPTLMGAGLTNRPVVKGQAPVVLNEKTGDNMSVEKDARIAQLESEIALLKTQAQAAAIAKETEVKAGEMKLGESSKTIEGLKTELAAIKLASANEQKKAAFDSKLKEGVVVEAQREAYMTNDMVKFMEHAKPVNFSQGGSGSNPAAVAGAADVEAKVISLATKAVSDKRAGSMAEAISLVLHEDTDLRKSYLDAGL